MSKRFKHIYCSILVMNIVGLNCWTTEAAQSTDQKVVERCLCQDCTIASSPTSSHLYTIEEKALALLPFGHIHPLCKLVLDYYIDKGKWLDILAIETPHSA